MKKRDERALDVFQQEGHLWFQPRKWAILSGNIVRQKPLSLFKFATILIGRVTKEIEGKGREGKG